MSPDLKKLIKSQLAGVGKSRQQDLHRTTRKAPPGKIFLDAAARSSTIDGPAIWSERLDAMIDAAERGKFATFRAKDPSTRERTGQASQDSIALVEDLNEWLKDERLEWQISEDGIARPFSVVEGKEERQSRRFDRLVALGGDRVPHGPSHFRASGKRGALASLVREEKAAKRPCSDQHAVRDDLDAEARRRHARRRSRIV